MCIHYDLLSQFINEHFVKGGHYYITIVTFAIWRTNIINSPDINYNLIFLKIWISPKLFWCIMDLYM